MNMQIDRQPFYKPHDILKAVQKRIEAKRAEGEPVDYVTFVPDGEPTLDINLKTEIALLKQLGTPIAVISNGSLIWNEKVRDDLMEADWVSLKIDAVDEAVWRRVNRPHKRLNLSAVLEGALTFSRSFEGTLATETMLAADVNDGEQNLRQVAEFLARLRPSVAYLSIPTRPPAEQWVYAPDENVVNRAYQILKTRVEHLEYLTGYEGEAFASTGNIQEDVLSITAVHPMREEAIGTLLQRVGSDWSVIDQMVAANQITPAQYEGHKYYVRRFKKKTG